MKLIVGLGNPGIEYKATRHNVGFNVLTRYASEHSASWQLKEKFRASASEVNVNGEKVLLMKPQTFYNNAGEAVQAITSFYKIPAKSVLLVHDELALPLGTVRTRLGGSDAGNNGVKSVTSHIGPETARIRVGITGENRSHYNDPDYVLSRFSSEEKDLFEQQLPHICQLIDSFITGTFEPTTHR